MGIRQMSLAGEKFSVKECPPDFAQALSGKTLREVLRVCSNWQLEIGTEWQNIPVAVNSVRDSGKIIIHCPGTGGSLSGRDGKYENLADYCQASGMAFVRTDGPFHGEIFDGPAYGELLAEKCLSLIDYALENAEVIGGKAADETEIYLMGVSAGAQGMAQVCVEFPQIKKVLLLSPAGPLPYDITTQSLARYSGDVITVAAEEDELIQLDVSEHAYRPDGARFIARLGAGHQLDLADLRKITEACLLEGGDLPDDSYMEL